MVIFTQPVCLAALNHLPGEKLFLLSRLTSSFHSLHAYMGQQFRLERLNPLNYLQERATWRLIYTRAPLAKCIMQSFFIQLDETQVEFCPFVYQLLAPAAAVIVDYGAQLQPSCSQLDFLAQGYNVSI